MVSPCKNLEPTGGTDRRNLGSWLSCWYSKILGAPVGSSLKVNQASISAHGKHALNAKARTQVTSQVQKSELKPARSCTGDRWPQIASTCSSPERQLYQVNWFGGLMLPNASEGKPPSSAKLQPERGIAAIDQLSECKLMSHRNVSVAD